MKRLLHVAALSEVLTGVILLLYPPIAIRLLFDSEIAGAGVMMSRIAGILMISLGVACWPDSNILRAFYGMLTYSVVVMLYLVSLGIGREVGILFWPAVAVHAGLSVLLLCAWWRKRKATKANT